MDIDTKSIYGIVTIALVSNVNLMILLLEIVHYICRRRNAPMPNTNSVATGVEYAKKQDMERALKAYKHALDIDPECVDAYCGITLWLRSIRHVVATGSAFANMGKFAQALVQFEKGLELDPGHRNTYDYYERTIDRLPTGAAAYRKTSVAYQVCLGILFLEFILPFSRSLFQSGVIDVSDILSWQSLLIFSRGTIADILG